MGAHDGPEYANVFYFYLGILKDAPGPLRELIDLQPTSDGERWLKVINLSNFLMAAYLTPYEVIEAGINNVMREAAELYGDVVLGKTESPFSELPRMHFLFLFQYLMRYSYSYGFFTPALVKAALTIDEGNLDNHLKAYALFFVNIAYLDTGAGDSFDFLLKEHANDLPLDLSLAYKHESDSLKERSALMRKQDKRIKRILKHNKDLARAVDALYQNPIKALSEDAKKKKS
jgi:NACHT C-terminal Helical domain 1